jgi:hypothetical protein
MAETAGGDPEGLLGPIQVMELERRGGAVISAGCTASPGLLHQDALDLTAALSDSLLGA